ncbi:uncharacterized protein LOC144363933 [Saccoglossus kowalevskii]
MFHRKSSLHLYFTCLSGFLLLNTLGGYASNYCPHNDDSCEKLRNESILLINDEWGTAKGGISTIHRQVVKLATETFLKVYALTLYATDEDRKDAKKMDVILIEPNLRPCLRDTEPKLDWFINHESFFPNLTQIPNIKAVVGHLPITGDAATYLGGKLETKKVILFNHVIPEDTEAYKDSWTPQRVQEKESNLFEAAVHNQLEVVIFSVGPRMYGHFENKFRAHEDNYTHHIFLPKPDEALFQLQIHKPNEGGKQQVIIFGRILGVEKLKGIDTIVKAMGEVSDSFYNIQGKVPAFIILGVPEGQHDEVDKGVKSFNDKYRYLDVKLYPYGTQAKIRTHLQQSHLCIMPSRSEPFGLVGLEAIAAGIPVLVTENSGLADFLKEEFADYANSVIVKVGKNDVGFDEDVNAWSKAISDILTMYDTAFDRAKSIRDRLKECQKIIDTQDVFKRVCEE